MAVADRQESWVRHCVWYGDQPPAGLLSTMDEVERLAVGRLQALQCIVAKSNTTDAETEMCVTVTEDKVGHYLLRLLMAKSASSVRFFVDVETRLFIDRLSACRKVSALAEVLTRSKMTLVLLGTATSPTAVGADTASAATMLGGAVCCSDMVMWSPSPEELASRWLQGGQDAAALCLAVSTQQRTTINNGRFPLSSAQVY